MAHLPEPAGLPAALRGIGRPLVMGVLNVTPDSFSDGGRYLDPDLAVARGVELVRMGADLVDVGGESTRPGAPRTAVEEELRRVLPVVRALAGRGVVISIDTMRAAVVEQAVEAGARVVNDVSGGLADPDMHPLVAGLRLPYIAMHWRGPSVDMDDLAQYGDVVVDVRVELGSRLDAAVSAGIDPAYVVLDPGLGFAKTAAHNWALLARLDALASLGRPLLVGASRKRFLTGLLAEWNGTPPDLAARDEVSAAVSALAAAAGVWCVRVHEPTANRNAVMAGSAWRDAAGGPR